MPADVRWIIEQLNQSGFEAYAVGGCVRDSILGREPGDWDITTSATPGQVKEIFGRTIDTGIQHGTVTVMKNHIGYEVTTYRIDGEYLDGRHPNGVEFTSDLLEDLKRRDFTINAMAYHHQAGLIDAFNGIDDIRKKQIRCVGKASDRFLEDALRILRALRFSAQLGFKIQDETFQAVKKIAPNLKQISKERVQSELSKLLLSNHPQYIQLIKEAGLMPYITDEFTVVFQNEVIITDDFPMVRAIRWAALLVFVEVEVAIKILKDLKLDNFTINRVKLLLQWQGRVIIADEIIVRKTMSQMQPDEFDDLIEFCIALKKDEEERHQLKTIKQLAEQIRAHKDCIYLKDLAVNGGDLIQRGIKPGKELGEQLSKLLELVLEHPEFNQKDYLLSKIF